MYTNHKSALYVVAKLKQQGICHIVISPGNSHNPMVRSIDEDSFFKTYSITDERSAAFFAIGIAQAVQAPVAIMCTSGTATCNYISGVTEAFRRNIPLVVITADKHPYFLNQLEDQMINQPVLFKEITKYATTIPEIIDKKDDWYCQRVLSEAFLEMNHHGTGPIHINVPISYGMHAIGDSFTTEALPLMSLIDRFDRKTSDSDWENLFASIADKRILFLCGQDISFSSRTQELLELVSQRFNCVLASVPISNLHTRHAVSIELINFRIDDYLPDIVITLNGSCTSDFKYKLKDTNKQFEHWLVHEQGKVADPYRKLRYVMEFDTETFLSIMAQYGTDDSTSEYFHECRRLESMFSVPEMPYSITYACQHVLSQLPQNSILHLGNSSTIRIAHYFDINPNIRVFCNRGVNGIDGCMSTFVGHASCTEEPAFLLIGDLTFFYDMNALWNRYLKNNMRIMLFNNSGASLFHFGQGLNNFPTLNNNVAAEHHTTAKGWVESLGFKYLSSSNQTQFENALPIFVSPESDAPILFEVFTDKETDAKTWHSIIEKQNPPEPPAPRQGFGIKTKLKELINKHITK